MSVVSRLKQSETVRAVLQQRRPVMQSGRRIVVVICLLGMCNIFRHRASQDRRSVLVKDGPNMLSPVKSTGETDEPEGEIWARGWMLL